ncbi:MAG: ABC transporter ATP-binding protein [Clostridia bacterium]|nr:MAG: ABC transporter ATP-binding protein [Clostridia bacterium]
MLEVKELMVFYENALAVNNLSLEVKEGEFVGIFGSNSAGKSTLMNTIAGLTLHLKYREERRGGERITILGRLKFDGEDITHLKPVDRVQKGIVLCRERHPIFRDNTVQENLQLGGYLRKEHEVKESIAFVFELFPSLKRRRNQKAGMLSGGEQEMLAIGLVLAARPRLLLMDEPLLGLSPVMQQELVRALKRLSQEKLTIFLAEQYARPIMPLIDRGYVIENGTLIVSGSGKELVDNPEVRSAYFGM